MDAIALAAALTVAGFIVFGLLGIYQLTASPRTSLDRRLGAILGDAHGGDASVADFESLRPDKVGRTPIISSLISGRTWTADLAERLEKADVKLTVSEFISIRVLFGLVGAAAAVLVLGTHGMGILAMLALGGAGWFIPGFWLNFTLGRRVKKLETQLVEALSLLSNALKSGFGLMQSFELASRQLEHPIATELRRMLSDINVGASTEVALQAFAERSGSKDVDIVITAMLIQQSTGGNLGEILDNVAHTMRERIRIKGEIKTLTTQQMLTGFIIGGLPFVIAGAFTLISPGYMTPLLQTNIGHILLIGAGMLEFVGIMVIKKILMIEV
jgi:tight adherence protein B